MHFRSGGVDPGRDGCRVPLPWSGEHPPFGFRRPGAAPWLPQPPTWGALTVEAQEHDPGSMLTLYRRRSASGATSPTYAMVTSRGLPAPACSRSGAAGSSRFPANLGDAPVIIGDE